MSHSVEVYLRTLILLEREWKRAKRVHFHSRLFSSNEKKSRSGRQTSCAAQVFVYIWESSCEVWYQEEWQRQYLLRYYFLKTTFAPRIQSPSSKFSHKKWLVYAIRATRWMIYTISMVLEKALASIIQIYCTFAETGNQKNVWFRLSFNYGPFFVGWETDWCACGVWIIYK